MSIKWGLDQSSWRCFGNGNQSELSLELKMKAIEMRLAEVPVKEVMDQLGIRNKTQIETWMR